MAILNVLDPPATAAALAQWFSTKVPGASEIRIFDLNIPTAAGMSMTTVLFKVAYRDGGEVRERGLVARVAPADVMAGLFPDNDLGREFRFLQTLGEDTEVMVPTVRWVEEDVRVLGSAFLVMDRVDGKVPPDDPPYPVEGWVLELSPEDRATVYENALAQVAELHRVDWQGLGIAEILERPRFGPPGIDQQIGYWEDFYTWASQGQPSPTIDAGFKWAKAHRPSGEELVLNWGDPRIGNVMYGDDLSVRAVLDWETATIASPEMDLGWFVFFARYYSEGIGIESPESWPSRERLIACYRELTGRVVNHIDYYEAFAALRLSILFLRTANLMISGGLMPPDNPMAFNNPASQILARLLGLPAPAGGEALNYVGKR